MPPYGCKSRDFTLRAGGNLSDDVTYFLLFNPESMIMHKDNNVVNTFCAIVY